MIEEYLNKKENRVWGYIEMADWYDNKRDEEWTLPLKVDTNKKEVYTLRGYFYG